MKKQVRPLLALLGLLTAASLFIFATWAGNRLPAPLGGLCFGAAGALLGVCGSELIMGHISRNWTPEERKEMERAERDERNLAIREKAAYSSWYWTLYLLWGLFALTLVLGSGLPTALVSATIVLHCIFYIVNMGRWAKRL